MMNKHPNLSSRIPTMFQYNGIFSENRISQILADENINNDTILAGIRNLGSCNLLISLKKPTHEIILGSMRTECHIVIFKTHLSGIYRECLHCGDEVNNTILVLYHSPFAKVILNYFITLIRIYIGIY